MKKFLACIFFISICSTTNAEVFQCKVNGNTVFQDKPCAGAKNGETIRDRVRKEIALQQEKTRKEEEFTKKMKEDSAKYQAERERINSLPEPHIGMHSGIQTKWGSPTTKNRTTTANSTKEQWVYRSYRGKTKYLYFTNDILTAISE